MAKNINNGNSCYKYGTAFPIKNAGRPKGSKSDKKNIPQMNEELKDIIHRKRFRDTL